jgi:hypothetical protein
MVGTGAVVWVWVVLLGVPMMAINAHERYALRRTGNG